MSLTPCQAWIDSDPILRPFNAALRGAELTSPSASEQGRPICREINVLRCASEPIKGFYPHPTNSVCSGRRMCATIVPPPMPVLFLPVGTSPPSQPPLRLSLPLIHRADDDTYGEHAQDQGKTEAASLDFGLYFDCLVRTKGDDLLAPPASAVPTKRCQASEDEGLRDAVFTAVKRKVAGADEQQKPSTSKVGPTIVGLDGMLPKLASECARHHRLGKMHMTTGKADRPSCLEKAASVVQHNIELSYNSIVGQTADLCPDPDAPGSFVEI